MFRIFRLTMSHFALDCGQLFVKQHLLGSALCNGLLILDECRNTAEFLAGFLPSLPKSASVPWIVAIFFIPSAQPKPCNSIGPYFVNNKKVVLIVHCADDAIAPNSGSLYQNKTCGIGKIQDSGPVEAKKTLFSCFLYLVNQSDSAYCL